MDQRYYFENENNFENSRNFEKGKREPKEKCGCWIKIEQPIYCSFPPELNWDCKKEDDKKDDCDNSKHDDKDCCNCQKKPEKDCDEKKPCSHKEDDEKFDNRRNCCCNRCCRCRNCCRFRFFHC